MDFNVKGEDVIKIKDDLRNLSKMEDNEKAIEMANDILCNLLATLGYYDVVREYKKVKK